MKQNSNKAGSYSLEVSVKTVQQCKDELGDGLVGKVIQIGNHIFVVVDVDPWGVMVSQLDSQDLHTVHSFKIYNNLALEIVADQSVRSQWTDRWNRISFDYYPNVQQI